MRTRTQILSLFLLTTVALPYMAGGVVLWDKKLDSGWWANAPWQRAIKDEYDPQTIDKWLDIKNGAFGTYAWDSRNKILAFSIPITGESSGSPPYYYGAVFRVKKSEDQYSYYGLIYNGAPQTTEVAIYQFGLPEPNFPIPKSPYNQPTGEALDSWYSTVPPKTSQDPWLVRLAVPFEVFYDCVNSTRFEYTFMTWQSTQCYADAAMNKLSEEIIWQPATIPEPAWVGSGVAAILFVGAAVRQVPRLKGRFVASRRKLG